MKTMITVDHKPMPNHNSTIGRNTRRGVALRAVMNGSRVALRVSERPSATPSGSATMMPATRPSANEVPLTASWGQISPVANIW